MVRVHVRWREGGKEGEWADREQRGPGESGGWGVSGPGASSEPTESPL